VGQANIVAACLHCNRTATSGNARLSRTDTARRCGVGWSAELGCQRRSGRGRAKCCLAARGSSSLPPTRARVRQRHQPENEWSSCAQAQQESQSTCERRAYRQRRLPPAWHGELRPGRSLAPQTRGWGAFSGGSASCDQHSTARPGPFWQRFPAARQIGKDLEERVSQAVAFAAAQEAASVRCVWQPVGVAFASLDMRADAWATSSRALPIGRRLEEAANLAQAA
jgi:hypothetical protein